MNKLFLTILAVFIFNKFLISQSHFLIPSTGASWDCTFEDTWDEKGIYYLTRYESMGDSTLNGKQYIKIYKTLNLKYQIRPFFKILTSIDSSKTLYSLIRNSDECKVYIIEKNDSVEYLLYNFKVISGDSIIIRNQDSHYFKVLETDSILINGKYRIKIKVINDDLLFGIESLWIEGIGSTSGLFPNQSISGEFSFYSLNCYKEHGKVIYSQGNNACYNFQTDIKQVDLKNEIRIYPLPIYNKSIISLPISFNCKDIFIIDMNLRKFLIPKKKNNNVYEIDREQLSPGMYFIEIIDYNGKILTKKICIQ